MNIYFLHRDPTRVPQMLCDRHLHYSILEAGQILSTVWWKLWTRQMESKEQHLRTFGIGAGEKLLNHPLVLWASYSDLNYRWLHKYLQQCFVERRYRWPDAGPHEFESYLWTRSSYITDRWFRPPAIFNLDFSSPPQIIDPSCIKQPTEFVEAYRAYYKKYKLYFMPVPLTKGEFKPFLRSNIWTKREMPEWLS